jgi:hypothetical protein
MADALTWRKKAEEYRTFADACRQESARQAFLALAASSEHIAELKERQALLERKSSNSPLRRAG